MLVTYSTSLCLVYEVTNFDNSYRIHSYFVKIWENQITRCVAIDKEICGSHSAVFEDSDPLGCDTARRIVSSTVWDSALQKLGSFDPKIGGRKSRHPRPYSFR
jgi:hypothetical protein